MRYTNSANIMTSLAEDA